MIGRGPLRLSHVLAVSVFTGGLVVAGFLTHPSPAFAGAGSLDTASTHVVTFDMPGDVEQTSTDAPTVGDLLHARGITVGDNDYLYPAAGTPVSDHMTIVYRPAHRVTLAFAHAREDVVSTAASVGTFLQEQGVTLYANDEVEPSVDTPIIDDVTVRVVRVDKWTRAIKTKVATRVDERLDFSLKPGDRKVIARGNSGVKMQVIAYVRRDDGPVVKHIVESRIMRPAHDRVVAVGIGEFDAFERFAQRSVAQTERIAARAMQMVATAYTAGCAGCSGITASGRPAGHGIVAVDPSVIPLGTRLYIPGYGFAVAGDTGGAIRGNRIDLGFNSTSEAMRFGRREVTVYQLK